MFTKQINMEYKNVINNISTNKGERKISPKYSKI